MPYQNRFFRRQCRLQSVLLSLGMLAFLGGVSSHAATAPTFSSPQFASTTAHVSNMVTGDFDNDGKQDVAVLDASNGNVEVRFGDGSGGYRSAASSFTITSSSRVYIGIAAADLDGDGQAELIFAAAESALIYDWQNGGSFTKTRTIDLTATGIDAVKVSVGNLTAAGSRDIVVSDDFGNVGVVWIPNDGAGTYGTPVAFAAGGVGYYARLVLADVDGDGLDDVIMARQAAAAVLLNKGDGTLRAEVTYGNSTFPSLRIQAVTVADVDNDGFPDLVVTGSNHDNATLNDTFYLNVNLSNAGNGTFADGKAFVFAANNGINIRAIAIEAADLNGDGRIDIVNSVDVGGTILVNGYSGIIVTRWMGTGANLAIEGQDIFPTNDGIHYSAVAVGDQNGDTQTDVLLGTDSTIFGATVHSQFVVFQNQAPTVLTGRAVQFGTIDGEVGEGDTIQIPVLRGSDSTGQVLVYIQFGGTALQYYGGANKNADYQLIDPPAGQPITFAEGEYRKTMTIRTLRNPAAEREDTLKLTILEPVGYAEVGDPSEATINILDGRPAILRAPSALTVRPGTLVRPIPATIPHNVKMVGRTGSDWLFVVNEAMPADARDATVTVQYSLNPASANSWIEYLALKHGKGTRWSADDRHPIICNQLYFRTVTRATGYPDRFGARSQPFAVIGGPELALNLRAASDSDNAGDTVHANEVITYHFTAANVSHDAAATPAVLTVPIPKHTTFLNATNVFGPFTQVKDRRGKTVAVFWRFASIPQSTTFTEDLLVQVDSPGMFSAAEQKRIPNGLGYIINEEGYRLSALAQGIKASPILHTDFLTKTSDFRTQIIGSLKFSVSTSAGTADPGGLITYTFRCENDSALPLTGAVVFDAIPAGTELATVYAFDPNSGNATSTPLPNPGAMTNPGIVYAKTDTKATIDLSSFVLSELPLLKPIYKAKPGRVVNLLHLSPETIKILVDDGFIEPMGVRWTLGTIPGMGNGQSNVRDVALTVRVPYDQPTTNGKSGSAITIVNNDYDFTIPGSNPPATAISALYGAAPVAVKVTLNNVAPVAQPHLLLSKSASGDANLNNPNFHGNGFTTVAGVGDVVSVVEGNGVDYQLTYRNDLDRNSNGADARGVVLHDVIPVGMTLRGFFKQNVNGTGFGTMFAGQFTFYDESGTIIPGVDPNTNQNNMALVRSMDIRLGSVSNLTVVSKNSFGTVRYTCEPNLAPTTPIPAVVHSFGGFLAAQGPSGKRQGFYISTSDQLTPVAGGPDDCVVRVVADVSWNFPRPELSVNDSQPFDVVPFDFVFTQNGDVSATNTVINFSVPQGVTFLKGTSTPRQNAVVTFSKDVIADPNIPKGHVVADGARSWDFSPSFVADNSAIIATQSGTGVQLAIGTIAGHSTHRVRVFFRLNGPALDPAIKTAHGLYGPVNPRIAGTYVSAPHLARAGLFRAAAGPRTAEALASGTNPMKSHELFPPKIGIVRSGPYSVKKGAQFTYTISFINSGDSDATNVTVGMQIPFRADFVSATNGVVGKLMPGAGIVPFPNGNGFTTTPRSGAQLKPAGGSLHPGPNIVTWHFNTLPAQSKGSVELVVSCDTRFGDEAIQDHSAYISADNVNKVHIAANDVTTWIFATTLDASKIQAAQAFFAGQGVTITPDLAPLVANVAKSLGTQSRVTAFGGLDALHMVSAGVKIIPIGKDQVFVVSNDGGSIVATGGGNVVSHDGGNIVAFGASSGISVKNISSTDSSISGTRNCSYLLDHIPAIVAAGAGNIVAAGAGNLITNDGGSLISNHPGGGFLANASQLAGSAVQVDGGGVVSNDGGSVLAAGAPLISQDGGGLISQDGGGLISQDGGGVISQDGGGLISQDGGGITVYGHGN